jgi:TRAP-type C4-dicarboxylate transport system substrate-binding protein
MRRREFLGHIGKWSAMAATATATATATTTLGEMTTKVFAGELAREEARKEKLAKYVFQFASPYFTDKFLTTPHAHQEIKALVEKYTKGKVYVKISDGGVAGIGSSLANSVRYGTVQGALLSVSNLSPMVGELDLLNIPFWSSDEKQYTRLFASSVWDKYVISKVGQYNLKILFPYIVGARTATSTRKYGKLIKTPKDFEGISFRIPGSKSLAEFYKLAKSIPMSIPWKFCAKTARAGRYDALDPSVVGLYSGPDGLNKELGTISDIESVHDGWVAIGNLDFIKSMDQVTRTQFMDAFVEVQSAQLALYHRSRKYCIDEFAKLGTKIYTPTAREKAELARAFGHQNPAYDHIKKNKLGAHGMKIFDELFKVANI